MIFFFVVVPPLLLILIHTSSSSMLLIPLLFSAPTLIFGNAVGVVVVMSLSSCPLSSRSFSVSFFFFFCFHNCFSSFCWTDLSVLLVCLVVLKSGADMKKKKDKSSSSHHLPRNVVEVCDFCRYCTVQYHTFKIYKVVGVVVN